MTTRAIHHFIARWLCALLLLAGAGWAAADPPSRVARLAYVSGESSFSPGGEREWARAVVNRPLITGDRLWVDRGGRAELQLGIAAIRVGSATSIRFLNLDDRVTQVELPQGTLNLNVRRLGSRRCVRGRYAKPGILDPAARQLSHRSGCRWPGHHGDGAPRTGRGLRGGTRFRRWRAAQLPLLRHRPHRLRIPRAAAARRTRPLGQRARPPLGQLRVTPLCLGGSDRLPGPGPVRHLASSARLRLRLGPAQRARRLGALSGRSLGVGRALGLDLGGRSALGLCAVALWPLGLDRSHLDVGARAGEGATRVRAGPGGVRGRRRADLRQWRYRSLVPAGSTRRLPALVYGQPHVLRQCEHQQHGREQHDRHQRLRAPRTAQRHLRQPAGPGRPDGRGGGGHRAIQAGAPGNDAGERREPGPRAGHGDGAGGPGSCQRGGPGAGECASAGTSGAPGGRRADAATTTTSTLRRQAGRAGGAPRQAAGAGGRGSAEAGSRGIRTGAHGDGGQTRAAGRGAACAARVACFAGGPGAARAARAASAAALAPAPSGPTAVPARPASPVPPAAVPAPRASQPAPAAAPAPRALQPSPAAPPPNAAASRERPGQRGEGEAGGRGRGREAADCYAGPGAGGACPGGSSSGSSGTKGARRGPCGAARHEGFRSAAGTGTRSPDKAEPAISRRQPHRDPVARRPLRRHPRAAAPPALPPKAEERQPPVPPQRPAAAPP